MVGDGADSPTVVMPIEGPESLAKEGPAPASHLREIESRYTEAWYRKLSRWRISRFVMLLFGFGNSPLFFLPILCGGWQTANAFPGRDYDQIRHTQLPLTNLLLPWWLSLACDWRLYILPAIHLERVDIPMPSSDKSSTSKVLHVFEGLPSFYCSNCSAVIASISHSTSLDCT